MYRQVAREFYGELPEVFVFSLEQSRDIVKLEFFDNVVKEYFGSLANSNSPSKEIYFKLFDSYQSELFLKKLNHSIKSGHQVEHYLTFSSGGDSEISLILIADIVSLTETVASWTGYMRVLSDEIKPPERSYQKKAFFYLAENSEDLILLFDKNGLITYCNSALCEFVNKSYEKLIGKAVSELNLGQQSLFLESTLRDILHLSGEVDLNFQVVLTPAKDKHVAAFVKLSPICQISGKYDAALMIVKLNSEIENIRHEYEILLNNIPDALVKFNTLGQITYVSKSIIDASKKPSKDYLYKTPVELNITGIEENNSKLLSSALDCMRVGERTNITLEFMFESNVKVLDILHVPIQDKLNGVIGALGVSRDITLLKKMEAEIKFEGSKFQTLADNSPDKIVRYDLNFNRVYVNRSFLQLYGVEYSDVCGKPISDANWAATNLGPGEFRKILGTIALTRKLQNIGLNIRNIKTGVMRVISLTIVPEINESGGVTSLLGVGRDITDLARINDELRKRETYQAALIDTFPFPVWLKDAKGRYLAVNTEFAKVNGYESTSQIIDKYDFDLFINEYAYGSIEDDQAVMAGRDIKFAVEKFKSILGDDLWMESFKSSVVLDGDLLGLVGYARDVTDFKRVEEQLRKSEINFRSLAHNAPVVIVRYNSDCIRTYMNPAYEEQVKVSISAALGTSPNEYWKCLLPKEQYICALRAVIETGSATKVMLEHYNSQGHLISHDVHLVPEFNMQKAIVGVLAIGTNVTDLKNSERMLKESREQVVAISAKRELDLEMEKRRISREIHDELGQLLSLIRLNVSSIDFNVGSDVLAIKEQCLKTILIIDRAISSVRNLAFQLRPDILDSGIVSALEWLVLDFSNNSRINCRLELSDKNISLGDNQSSFIFRIVQESLTNILRHAHAKNVLVDILETSNQFILTVSDDGVGFQFGNQNFYNSVGIQGMRERAIALGGRLEIQTKEGVGTAVIFSLPLAE